MDRYLEALIRKRYELEQELTPEEQQTQEDLIAKASRSTLYVQMRHCVGCGERCCDYQKVDGMYICPGCDALTTRYAHPHTEPEM